MKDSVLTIYSLLELGNMGKDHMRQCHCHMHAAYAITLHRKSALEDV